MGKIAQFLWTEKFSVAANYVVYLQSIENKSKSKLNWLISLLEYVRVAREPQSCGWMFHIFFSGEWNILIIIRKLKSRWRKFLRIFASFWMFESQRLTKSFCKLRSNMIIKLHNIHHKPRARDNQLSFYCAHLHFTSWISVDSSFSDALHNRIVVKSNFFQFIVL